MKEHNHSFSRRDFLAMSGTLAAGSILPGKSSSSHESKQDMDPVIDIHQHIFYVGRTDDQLIHHQKTMGVTHTIMLPAGSVQYTQSTHYGRSNGLQAQAGGNKSCFDFAQAHAKEFSFAANEVPDIPDAVKEVEKYLQMGAKMIAEVKFGLSCDSQELQRFYSLAAEYGVPILMHWQYETYNYSFPYFYKMLEKYPKTKFIGHAQTWWANVDKAQQDHPWEMYPNGPVIKGGITDRYLSDYENMYGDLSAGSGLNFFRRDEDFTKDFFTRHQDKLLFGSDCSDLVGEGEACIGAQTIALVRKLMPKGIERKLLYENAKKMFTL
ncbi:MAG: amidohydrolase [Chitinophagaceae bacterium]|nr:MAG: amidohydrolase [Chitinophagaceae bacterium]